MNATVLALIICLAAAGLEGASAGTGVRQRLAELRMPAYSPPFTLWLVIGAAYYLICLVVLRQLLASESFSPSIIIALLLLILVLIGNALWSVLFFRRRDLRASFVAFIPYGFVVAALIVLLLRIYPFGAFLFLCYGLYLLYATWWGYRLWILNAAQS